MLKQSMTGLISGCDANILQDVCAVMQQNLDANPELIQHLISQIKRYQNASQLTMHTLEQELNKLRSKMTESEQFASCTYMIALVKEHTDQFAFEQSEHDTNRAETGIMKSVVDALTQQEAPVINPDPVGFVPISREKARERFRLFHNTLDGWNHCINSTSNPDDALQKFIKLVGGHQPEAYTTPLKRLVMITHSDKPKQEHSIQCALALASYVLGESPVELQNRVNSHILRKLQEIHDAYVYDAKQDFGID